jgi:hypothetical protein
MLWTVVMEKNQGVSNIISMLDKIIIKRLWIAVMKKIIDSKNGEVL